MFSLITTIITIALAVGVTGATMYYLGSAIDEGSDVVAAAELLTQSEQIAAAIDMRAFQEDGSLSDLNALVTGKYLLELPIPPAGAFVSEVSSTADWQVPTAHERPVVLVNNKIKASVCAAFNNKMLNDSAIPAQANPALRIQCYGAAEPYSLVINPQMTRAPLEAVLQPDAIQPDPDAALPQTVALSSATLCFKQGVAGSFDFKTVFSASQETNPTMAEVVWSASGMLPAGMSFDTATGVLSGTPTETTSGDYTVTASYKNAEGQQVYKLLVKGSELEAVQLSVGASHTCAITVGRQVKCWGLNQVGQLGDGTTISRGIPASVLNLDNVKVISVGYAHTCAVTAGQKAYCWGNNGNGQLGDATKTAKLTPVAVQGLVEGVSTISAGLYQTCALSISGSAYCWGRNALGQLGDDTWTDRTIPVPVLNLGADVASISTGLGQYTCAVTTAGTVSCWGANPDGQLGDGSTTKKKVATPVLNLTNVRQVKTGASHSCALSNTGLVSCWGLNSDGQLGNGTTINSSEPVSVVGLESDVINLTAGQDHTCALRLTGQVKCWGSNGQGALGVGEFSVPNALVPVEVPNLVAASVQAGQYYTCAITTKGIANCWGHNLRSQLGLGSNVNASRSSPTSVVSEIAEAALCTGLTLTASSDGAPTISGTISLTPATLPSFTVGTATTYNFAALYKDSLNAFPNMADVTWSGVGTLPPGLMLDPVTGELFGIPTATASASYTVKATYKGSNSGQQTYLIVVR